MAQANPVVTASLLQNPTLDASPSRYGADDTANANRRVSLLAMAIPEVAIQGGSLEIRGHFPGPPIGRDAQYFANFGSPGTQRDVSPITAETPYEVSPRGASEMTGPTRTVRLRQLTALANIRDYSADNFAEFYPEQQFQMDAIRHTISIGWEATVAAANIPEAPIETLDGPFNGLPGLSRRAGSGQTFNMGVGADLLDELDLIIQRVFANGGRCDALVMNEAAIRAVSTALRARGIRPMFVYSERLEQVALHYDGITVVRSDFVPNTTTDGGETGSTQIYAMSLGGPNGVYSITSQDTPGIQFREVRTAEPPFTAVQGLKYCALVSPTSDALIELKDVPVIRPIFVGGTIAAMEV